MKTRGFALALAALLMTTACEPKDPTPLAESELAAVSAALGAPGPDVATLEWETLAVGDLRRNSPFDLWTFEADAEDAVFLDLANREGRDMYLLLYATDESGRLRLFAHNDDCYEGTLNACLRVALPSAGTWTVVATTYDYLVRGRRSALEYHLRLSCENGDGRCAQPPDRPACGSRGLPPCAAGFYCDWAADGAAAACGADDRGGVCEPIPADCPQLYAPVCGCDGVTYVNDCHAHLAGVDTAAAGLCDPSGRAEGELCGGIAGFPCQAGLVCDYRDTVCGADIAGVCVVWETVMCSMVWAPVCGCDGVTYGNDCVRRGANVGLDHLGECE